MRFRQIFQNREGFLPGIGGEYRQYGFPLQGGEQHQGFQFPVNHIIYRFCLIVLSGALNPVFFAIGKSHVHQGKFLPIQPKSSVIPR